MKNNNKLLLITTLAIVLLIVVGLSAYNNKRYNKNEMMSEEFENATVVLEIPEGEEGVAPGTCKLSLLSKSSAYPVEISDISTFYEFSDEVTNCEGGKMTIINPENKAMQKVSYVSIVLSSATEGVTKSDTTTGVLYTTNYSFTEDVLNVSINIEESESEDKSEVLRNILLTEVGSLFNQNENEDLFETYESLSDLGLTLAN